MPIKKLADKITITERILRRPVSVTMITLLIIFFGLFSLSNLKITLFPPFNIPILAISSGYKSVSPQDMQRLIVEPLEAAASGINGVDELESNISKGNAFLILRMEGGADIRSAELDLREEIDRIRNELPGEASEPVIFQFDPENFPIMRLSIKSDIRGLDELRQLSTEFIEPRLERLDGVASADTRGGLIRTIYVDLQPMSLAQHNLEPQEILNAIRSNNVQMPIGDVRVERTNYSVRAQSMYQSVEEIRKTIITQSATGVPIRVQDVAKVTDGYEDVATLVEINGKNSVSIEIQKQSDANTLDVSQAVMGQLDNIEAKLPRGVEINTLNNEGDFIENSIMNLAQSALIALAVVIVILLLFMGGWRISLIVALSIPVSIAATFSAMYFAGLTLNIISITGLALAIGLLVDNSIVVSESIAGKLEEDMPKYKAALEGTNEVIGALLGSTLTTLGVFIPILGISGFAGQIARDLALTICIAISSSFLASIVLIPVLASLFLNKGEFERHSLTFRLIHRLERYYVVALRWVMGHKWTALVFVLVAMGGSYWLYQNIPGGFFPQQDTGEIDARIELPSGTKLVRTAETMRNFSNRVQQLPEVETVVTKMGQRGFRSQPNVGEMTVKLVPNAERDRSTQDISLQLRKMLQAPDVDVRIRGAGGGGPPGGFGSGIRLTLTGPDVDVLKAITNKIENVMLQDSNIISVDNPRVDPAPELHYTVDRQRLSRMGRSFQEVANNLKAQTMGSRAGYYRDKGREIPIMVRIGNEELNNREELYDLELVEVDSQRVSVAALGRFESVQGLSRISRRDRETVLDVSIEFKGDLTTYRDKIRTIMDEQITLPAGYRYEFTGSSRDADESGQEMLYALFFAILLTYMVMASQFENLRDPFIIMVTIPLAFIGSLGQLWITGTALSVPASIGIVILIGIVVNNGIVLVDYIHKYTDMHEGKRSYLENFIEAARRRMRPILLTALTTICSMIPLALEIGTGAETWSPMAQSVIGGLIFATVLSLFIVPAFVVGISQKRRMSVKEALDRENRNLQS